MRNKTAKQRQQKRQQRRRAERKANSGQRRGYMHKLLEIPAKPGEFQHIEVQHDDWCEFWPTGKGQCNCYPHVQKVTIQ